MKLRVARANRREVTVSRRRSTEQLPFAADVIARTRDATSKPRRPACASVQSVPSHPPTSRGRPTARMRITPTRRTLVAALTHRTARPRASNS